MILLIIIIIFFIFLILNHIISEKTIIEGNDPDAAVATMKKKPWR